MPARKPCPCRPAWEGSRHIGGKDDYRMRKAITSYRAAHPFCERPGCGRLMAQVDHIVPLAEGGDRYDPSNLQSLCMRHHNEKNTADALRGKTRAR